MIFQILFQFIVFVIASFFSFFVPGAIIVSFLKTNSKLTNLLLSFVLGIVMWAIQGYVFGYLGLRWLTYLYLGFSSILLFLRQRGFIVETFKILPEVVWRNRLTSLLILFGIVVQLIPVAGSGLVIGRGMTFFGNLAHDGLTHLGFIQSLIAYFPPIEPGVYDLPLRNYHYLSDLVMAEFSRIWKIPIALLLFQFFPFFISLFTGIAAFLVIRTFGGSKSMASWMIFLMYFAGDSAYIFMLILHKTFGFNTPAIDNGALQFLNMPNAMTKMIFLTALIPLHYFIVWRKKMWGVLSVFFLAPLVGFKIYFGIFSILGFSLLIFVRLIFRFIQSKGNVFRRWVNTVKSESFSLFLILLFAGIVAAIYFPANSSAGGLLYTPLEWSKSLLGSGSIDWQDWWFRMQVYVEHKNYRNIIIYNAIAVVITLVSVYGTRLLGFFLKPSLLRFLGWEKGIFLIPGLLIFNFLGLNTLQSVGGLNVFNFFIVCTVVLSLFSSFILGQLSDSKKISAKIFIVIFVILTIPRVANEILYSINNYRASFDSHTISREELQAMKYIDDNLPANAIVQASPNNEKEYRVGYVSTFSKREPYLAGIVFLETRNQPILERKNLIKELFELNNAGKFAEIAKKNNIQYIYLQKIPEHNLRFSLDKSMFETIFENKFITILKVI